MGHRIIARADENEGKPYTPAELAELLQQHVDGLKEDIIDVLRGLEGRTVGAEQISNQQLMLSLAEDIGDYGHMLQDLSLDIDEQEDGLGGEERIH